MGTKTGSSDVAQPHEPVGHGAEEMGNVFFLTSSDQDASESSLTDDLLASLLWLIDCHTVMQ